MKNKNRESFIGIDKEKTKKVNNWLLTAYLALQTAAIFWTFLQDNPNANWNTILDDAKENIKELIESKIHIEKTTNDFPMNYLYPVNFVAEWKEHVKDRQISLDVPYKVAHNFDLADVLDDKNYAMADSIVQAEITKAILENIVWFDFAKKEWSEKSTPDTLSNEIILDSVGGFSSPEAKKYWDNSLIPWKKERENINLAKNIRGNDARNKILRAFRDIMAKYPNLSTKIDTTSIHFVGDELQLNDMQEYNELKKMAAKLRYPSIVEMLSAYNVGKIKNTWDVARIDDLIWSKRKIMLAFTLKDKEKTVIVLPIFLPILLLIPFVRIMKYPNISPKQNNKPKTYYPQPKEQKWYSKVNLSKKTPRLNERANENHAYRWQHGTDSRTWRKNRI